MSKNQPTPADVEFHSTAIRAGAPFCDWKKSNHSWGFSISCSDKWLMNENYGGDECPMCKSTIRYVFP